MKEEIFIEHGQNSQEKLSLKEILLYGMGRIIYSRAVTSWVIIDVENRR